MIRRLVRYGAVSIVATVTTQAVLLVLLALEVKAALANVIAVSTAAVPGYLLNRAWVFGVRGRNSFRTEILPFWGFTLAGLALSTGMVAGMALFTSSHLVLAATNVAAFGLLWVAKFLVLDDLVFNRVVTETPEGLLATV